MIEEWGALALLLALSLAVMLTHAARVLTGAS